MDSSSITAAFANKRTSTSNNKEAMVKKWQQLLSDLAVSCRRLVKMESLELGLSSTDEFNGKKQQEAVAGDNAQSSTECINHVRSLATSIDTEMLNFKPINPSKLWATSFCSPVDKHKNLYEMSVFGLRSTGNCIPLHDHPKMYGFIRPLYGRIRISSFSWLEPEIESKLATERKPQLLTELNASKLIKRPARYEGQIILDGTCKEPPIATLGSTSSNLHSIEALEDGAAFLDVLVPGYQNNRVCTYYSISGDKEPTKIGEIVWLEGSEDVPANFSMQEIKLIKPF